jgi:hypothetical protein
MSASITETEIRQQLAAMGCPRVDLGALNQRGRMTLAADCGAKVIPSALRWLRRENARGAHIFIRPSGMHALTLVDDPTAHAITMMKHAGFEPTLVIETSPANFQAWLKHGRILDQTTSTAAAKELASRFGGDPSSADWRHFGRLAGFTNQKPRRRLPNGWQPFVKLRECSGRIYSMVNKFLDEVTAIVAQAEAEGAAHKSVARDPSRRVIKTLSAFHGDPRYGGDLHRGDLAWAIYAASRALSEQTIKEAILDGRDLSEKGRLARQHDYAQRTALKALAIVQPTR